MKIFLCGQKSFGLETLLLLLQRGDEVVGVSAPRKSDGDGKTDKLFAYAEAVGLAVTDASALRAEHLPAGTDLIVCAHAHTYIGRRTRYAAKFGAIGYHPSLLPRHRGRDSVAWSIKMNDFLTGGTVFWLDDSIDGGDIAAQSWCWIEKGETASDLWREKLFPLGIKLFDKVLTDISHGKIVRIKQNERVATFEPAIHPPRLFRPELLQLTDGKNELKYQTLICNDS